MHTDPLSFYESIIAAGTILSGFCGTFLAFRIQRDATYYRQPVLSFERGEAKDIHVGLTHFTSTFLLLILGTVSSTVFGFLLPLIALAGCARLLANPGFVVGGLVGTLILIAAYFVDELIHCSILSTRLLGDAREWGSEKHVVIGGIALAVVSAIRSCANGRENAVPRSLWFCRPM